MSQEILTIILSVLAIFISAFNLGWNVYKDAIRRPRFVVSVSIKKIIQRGMPDEGPYIIVEALNVGPIANRSLSVFVRKSWLSRKFRPGKHNNAFVYPDYSNRIATKAASKIEVGDQAIYVVPLDRDAFLKENFSQIGVSDGFGKIHWASKREMKQTRSQFEKMFTIA
jgi:hypothetical protein